MVAGNSSCAGSPDTNSYTGIYHRVSVESGPETEIPSAGESGNAGENGNLDAFLDLYRDITRADVAECVRAVYAESLYFSDTLKTFHDHHALAVYLAETAERVEFNRVSFHRVLRDGEDYYVRWSMETGFRLLGRQIRTSSIGMSHIRLDGQGKVKLHQDFWDNTEGFFRHLPVIGILVGMIKRRL